jgi:threonine dehydrogenase-like Zn-dependent dehydrogenase
MHPSRQTAVQLVAPDRLQLNAAKAVSSPNEHQILCKVQCVGLCYSDMKLLHQFDRHPRKSAIRQARTVDAAAWSSLAGYVPGDAPTVPGHEAVVEVVAIGAGVRSVRVGGRYLVQADYRDLTTERSNAAFGYNFEGALQEFVLIDERVIRASDGDEYLLPVPADRAASQLALIEPWACVEEAYIHRERRQLAAGGTLVVAAPAGVAADWQGIDLTAPARRLRIGAAGGPAEAGWETIDLGAVPAIDDLVVIGHQPGVLERLFPNLKPGGIALVALAGQRIGAPLSLPLGRVHYGPVRLAATPGARIADALACIPEDGGVGSARRVHVIGAGGPMGVMAMARSISAVRPGAEVEGSVRNAGRADALRERIMPMAEARQVAVRLFDPGTAAPSGPVDYAMLMAPVPELIERAIAEAAPGGIINLFAGIPSDEPCRIDLDLYAAKRLCLLGTSGSTVADMRAVLEQVLSGSLDTNLSVAAVAGMAGAIAGLESVRDRTIAGKIVVYPELAALPLLTLAELAARHPSVGALLSDGCWTKAAEAELLRVAAD